ncbi:MAG TPA: DUF1552 domain-containing protein [Polyangiaceae bacterium]|nr:DUF1552 domain-containing protein [Polyangiaceae bacterium]
MSIHRVAGRRAFLAGGAAIVALPFLESLELRTAQAQAVPLPKRLLYYYVPNGIHMATFKPTAAGPGYPTPAMLMPLESLKADFTVVTGLENAPAKPDGAGDHASGTSSFITCVHALKSETTIQLGISADQVAAKAIGTATRIPSMQLGMSGGSTAGNCDSGYGCAYARNISWADVTTPLPKVIDPVKVFDQIFAGANPTETATAAAKRRAYDKSVLDAVTGDAKGLTLKLGKSDNVKLDQYMTSVRALETKLMSMTPVSQCTPGTKPAATTDFPTKVTIMSDLMVLAMQCDATRIITFMLGNAISGQTYPALGITGGHHDISHHANDPTKLSQLASIGLWEITQLAYLMNKMKSVTEGPGGSSNLLYNSTIFFSSDISDGNRHNHDDMPIIVAGNGGGALTPGKHLSFPTNMKQKVSNLLVTMLGTAGVPTPTVGDSTGPLAGL